MPFAGYEMPVYYPSGILSEHKWTREKAGLFDVSHMGQATLLGADFAIVALALEKIVPADVQGLKPGQQRYTQLLNHEGGVIDDLMVVRGKKDGEVHLVVNASRKEIDYHWIRGHLDPGVSLNPHDDLALLALQGPKAADVIAALWPKIHELAFMQTASVLFNGISVFVSRSGYTGEDGFEISLKGGDAAKLWEILLADKRVKPIGLGARDSLRLEAGLCLYGHELDETISPVEASLGWSIAKPRRETGGFIGAARVQDEMRRGVVRKRVGIKPEGRAPAREGTEIHDGTMARKSALSLRVALAPA